MKPARTRGFTLVELMIVVAIIALLAAIAVPVLSEMSLRAKLAEYVTNDDGILKTGWGYAESVPPDSLANAAAWPRDAHSADGQAIAWDPTPADWTAWGWSPDGAVRCVYGGQVTQPGPTHAVTETTVVASSVCDVDDDNLVVFETRFQGDPVYVVQSVTYCKGASVCVRGTAGCMCF